jgi:hypothetical protein
MIAQATRPAWIRHVLGIAGIACLVVAGYLFLHPPETGSSAFLQGSCIKSGLVLLATWLAYPQLDRLPSWLLMPLLGIILALTVRPRVTVILLRFGVILLPIFIAIWLLRPKARRRKDSGTR